MKTKLLFSDVFQYILLFKPDYINKPQEYNNINNKKNRFFIEVSKS